MNHFAFLVIVGMAIQAFSTGVLAYCNVIQLTPGQQVIAGMLQTGVAVWLYFR